MAEFVVSQAYTVYKVDFGICWWSSQLKQLFFENKIDD